MQAERVERVGNDRALVLVVARDLFQILVGVPFAGVGVENDALAPVGLEGLMVCVLHQFGIGFQHEFPPFVDPGGLHIDVVVFVGVIAAESELALVVRRPHGQRVDRRGVGHIVVEDHLDVPDHADVLVSANKPDVEGNVGFDQVGFVDVDPERKAERVVVLVVVLVRIVAHIPAGRGVNEHLARDIVVVLGAELEPFADLLQYGFQALELDHRGLRVFEIVDHVALTVARRVDRTNGRQRIALTREQPLQGVGGRVGGSLVRVFETLFHAVEGERHLFVGGFGQFRLFAARREGENGREGHNCRKQKEQDLFHNRTSNQRATAGASARFPRGSANTDPLLSYNLFIKKSTYRRKISKKGRSPLAKRNAFGYNNKVKKRRRKKGAETYEKDGRI